LREKKDIINAPHKKKIFRIILFLSIIITSIGIFLASYYLSVNNVYSSYKTTLVANINGINDVNKNVSQFNSNQTIDVDYAKKQLPNIINDLSVFKDNLLNSDPTTKYKKDTENLKSGLDKNLLIYKQTLAILNNPSASGIETSMQNLKTSRNDCINFYSLVDIHNTSISLPKISLTFIDNVLNYSYSAVIAKEATTIKSQQSEDFISEIDGIFADFLDTKINFHSYVIRVRKKEMSYDALSSLVDDDFEKLSKIQTIFINLSVPPSAIPSYESFKSLLDNQENYLSNFKLALTSENVQTSNAVIDSSTLDALYSSSNSLFNEVVSSYNAFVKVYAQLKNK